MSDAIAPDGVWTNFSGLISSRPKRVEQPAHEDAIRDLVTTGSEAIRVVGTGHSSTPLCATDALLINLDAFAGIESIDPDSRSAVIRAGSKIHDIGEPLGEAGLATLNQGDVDVQSIAGAISTGTHGTGMTLQNMSSSVRGLRIVLADGEVLGCDASTERDVFEAAQLSLGCLGIITHVDFQLRDAYNLHQREWKEDLDGSRTFLALSERSRHLEFFWSPANDAFYMKSLNITDAPPDPLPDRKREVIGRSADIFPSIREDKFHEMEYAVPIARGMECFYEIRAMMQRRHPDVVWPVEVRTLAADGLLLSVARERATITISIHQGADQPFRALFDDAEAIFARYEGRPHWGKCHSLGARELAERCPGWQRFREIRRRLDPEGRFLNRYLRDLFEPA
jgi:FAD/FMN-containing dehydrogenase